MSVSFESMTARQIADLHATEVFPDAASAIALIRVLAARVAELEARVGAPVTLSDECVASISTKIVARLQKETP